MAKIKRVKKDSDWSYEDRLNAHKIVAYAKDVLRGDNHETHLIACRELFGVPYTHQSMIGVRSYISHLSAVAKEERRKKDFLAFLKANLPARVEELEQSRSLEVE